MYLLNAHQFINNMPPGLRAYTGEGRGGGRGGHGNGYVGISSADGANTATKSNRLSFKELIIILGPFFWPVSITVLIIKFYLKSIFFHLTC